MPNDSSTPASPDATRNSQRVRVLVADDGKNAADIMGLFLKMEGYDVRVVYDGAQAIQAAGEYDPHLIFMDISMPGIDGIEATRRIRETRGGDAPAIIALTGYDQPETMRRCEEAGVQKCVSKPVSPADLRALLKEFTGGEHPRAAPEAGPLIPGTPGVLPG